MPSLQRSPSPFPVRPGTNTTSFPANVSAGDLALVTSVDELHALPPAYAERVRFRARRQAQYSALRDLPCVTKDGQPIDLMINAGLVIMLIAAAGVFGWVIVYEQLPQMAAAWIAAGAGDRPRAGSAAWSWK